VKKRGEQDKSQRRRVYRVERLSVEARDCVLSGFAQGKHYHEIQAELAALGVKISAGALSNYWRHCWHFEEDRVRTARALSDRMALAIQKTGKTHLAVVGREMLFTKVFEKLKELDKASVWQLLREARELERVTSGKKLGAEDGKEVAKSAAGQAREIRRRWRALYGLDEADEEANDKEETDAPV
jgi:hypothetical protein